MSQPTNKFQVRPPKPAVDPKKLEEFANSAAGLSLPSPAPAPANPVGYHQAEHAPVSSVIYSVRSKALLLRLLPEQFDRLEQVFAHSSYKSKQTMGEKLLMDAVEDLAKKLGI